jgi:hypothetical protein
LASPVSFKDFVAGAFATVFAGAAFLAGAFAGLATLLTTSLLS